MLHAGVAELGLELLVKDKENRLPCVTAILYVSRKASTGNLYSVEISGGLGAQAGKIWRVGLMGYNCTPDNVRLGLESSWVNHKACVEMLHAGVAELGLELLVKDKENRLPCVTAICVPRGVNWKFVSDYAMNRYRVEISGGLGAQAGKIWRVGLMGYNCTPDNVKLVLRALSEGLKQSKL